MAGPGRSDLQPNLSERLRSLRLLPTGTVPVAGGLIVSAATSYLFLIVSARALGSERYSSLAALWALVFLATGGLYFPVEQETARQLSARAAHGIGGGPVLRRAGLIAISLAGLASVGLVIAAPKVIDELFDGEALLLAAIVVALCGYSIAHALRGALAGVGLFTRYGMTQVVEGAVRAAGCVALFVLGVKTPGPFGFVVALAPIAVVLYALRSRDRYDQPGTPVSLRAVLEPVSYLLAASVASALLLNVAPLVVKVLATSAQKDATGRFLNGVIVARIPLFFFSAVQAAVLPKLSNLAAGRQHSEFRSGVQRLVLLVVVVGGVATAVAAVAGPTAMRIAFGADYVLGRRDLALIAIASACFMMTQALSQALIALGGHAHAAAAWVLGLVTFTVPLIAASGLFVRVELGLLAGCGSAAVAMALFVRVAMKRAEREPVVVPEALEMLPVVGVEVVE